MSNYKIITDSACDLPAKALSSLDVSIAPLSVLFRGETMADTVGDAIKVLFEGLRKGETATTSAVNPEGWSAVMEPLLKEGKDLLVLCFSSALSTTYQSAVIATEELREKYPDRKINVVDTLCAALGQGFLVTHACKKRDEGLTLDELTAWVEENKLHICHWVTVNDLMHLKRGGRISATTAIVGSMLQFKPVIHLNEEGKLINVGKIRGRKASMEHLAEKMSELMLPTDNDTVFITHGDCLDEAKELEKILKKKCGVKKVFIGHIGAVIGSHTGPGVLAVFFFGEHR